MSESTDLYEKYRPESLDDIIGQPDAVSMLRGMVKGKRVPGVLLFTGPSGVGKTTVARIMARLLKCQGGDYYEANCADVRGIEDVRTIGDKARKMPLFGKTRVFTLDECHRFTADAQHALLKELEGVRTHVRFALCTTEPNKLLRTIRTRATEVSLRALSEDELAGLVRNVCRAEKADVGAKVVDRIAEQAAGSARMALVLLGSVIHMESDKQRLKVLKAGGAAEAAAIDICRALIDRKKWSEIADVIARLPPEEDWERLRRCVLGYASAVLLKREHKQAACVLMAFESNVYDSGRAGFILACWNARG